MRLVGYDDCSLVASESRPGVGRQDAATGGWHVASADGLPTRSGPLSIRNASLLKGASCRKGGPVRLEKKRGGRRLQSRKGDIDGVKHESIVDKKTAEWLLLTT
mmetsp:Transcript_9985/g.37734  ORF Transcript_9985/g.37734 Transcript_9985/m.37734 type:complete len:104 (+) Transcript_9985:3178-3489(+)|eukprot:scaffold128_cov248-Pinguiococcus_pyrenoidosus.AAC.7